MSYYYSPSTGMPVPVGGMPMPVGGMPMPGDRSRMYAPASPVSLQAGAYAQQQACVSAGVAPSGYRQQVAMPAPGYPPNTIAYAPGYTAGSPYQLSTAPYPTASMAQGSPLLSGASAAYASAYSMPGVAHPSVYPYSQYRGVPMSSHAASVAAYQQQQQQQQSMQQQYAQQAAQAAQAAQLQRPASSYSPPGAVPPTGPSSIYPAGAYSRGMPPL